MSVTTADRMRTSRHPLKVRNAAARLHEILVDEFEELVYRPDSLVQTREEKALIKALERYLDSL